MQGHKKYAGEEAILFENKEKRNRAYIMEFYRCVWAKRIQALYVLAILLFLLTVGLLVLENLGVSLLLSVVGFLAALVCALKYDRIMPYYMTKREYQQRQYLYGAYGEMSFQFTEEEIRSFDESSGSRVCYQLKDVGSIQETLHLILLGLPGNMWLLIGKNAFTKGTQDDFWEYLHTFCPQAEWQNGR